MNRSMIGSLMVNSSSPYIVYGPIRGLVSEHKSATQAQRSLERDQRGAKKQGGFSDAAVFIWRGAWTPNED